MSRTSAAAVVGPTLMAVFFGAPAASAADRNLVTAVTFRDGNVEITAERPPIFKVHKRPGSGRLVVDILTGVLSGVPREQTVNQDPVTYIRAEESGEGASAVVHVIIGLSREIDLALADSGNTLVIKFGAADVVAPQPDAQAPHPAPATGPPSAAALPAASKAEALTRRATVEYDGGEFDQALADARKAYAIQPASDLLYNLGVCQWAAHRREEAAVSFQAYLLKMPDAPERPVIEALIQQSATEQGAPPGDPQLKLNPFVPLPDPTAQPTPPEPTLHLRETATGAASVEGLTRRAGVEYDRGDFGMALADVKRAYAIQPTPGLLYDLGLCQRALHHREEAAVSLQAYLREWADAPDRTAVEGLIRQMDDERGVTVAGQSASPVDPESPLNPFAVPAVPDLPLHGSTRDADATPASGSGLGKLTISSRPVAEVFVDGRATGRHTPVSGVDPLELSSGPHLIHLESADGGKADVQVTIRPQALTKLAGVTVK